jgi:hypothetical protein
MKLRHTIPFLIILFQQGFPLQVERTPSGHYRLSFGLGGGSYPQDFIPGGCTGSSGIEESGRQPFSSGGAQVDAWPAQQMRMSASGGGFVGWNSGRVSTFFGLQGAWEARHVGLGAGYSATDDETGRSGLSAYLRLGDIDGMHARADLRAPTPTWGVTGWSRVGIGYNQGLRRGFGAFVGLSKVLGHANVDTLPKDALAVFADLTFQLGRRWDLLLRGHAGVSGGPGFPYGLGFGLRYNFGE